MKKAFCMALIILLICLALFPIGCGTTEKEPALPGDPSDSVDKEEQVKEKSVLKIGISDGHLGNSWVEKLAEIFEELYKDTEFETGKKGVQVFLSHNRDYPADMYDLYLFSGTDLFSKNVAEDMTSLFMEKVYDENGEISANGTKSLLDRIDPNIASAFNYGTKQDPIYYLVPYEWGRKGFVYNHDLFQKKGWLTYSGIGGVPETTKEFIDLLNKISGAGHIAYTLSFDNEKYMHEYQYGFLAQYEGEEKALLNLTYNGLATFAPDTFDEATIAAEGIMVAEDGTQSVIITEENAWLLAQQAGKNEYVKFLREIINKKYLDPDINMTHTSSVAQKSFILSNFSDDDGNIAMLFDAEWWERESKPYFDINAYGEVDFRFMPIPQAEGGVNEKQTVVISNVGPCYIKKGTNKKELASKWIQMMYSATGCKIILENTGMVLPVQFSLTDEEFAKLTPFARSVYTLKTSKDVDIFTVSPYQSGVSDLFLKGNLKMSGYGIGMKAFALDPDGGIEEANNNVFNYFWWRDHTAEEWIQGAKAYYTKTAWTEMYDKFISQQ